MIFTRVLFICDSFLWSANWPELAAARGFSGLSHKPVQGSTAAIARKRRDLAEQSVECGAVMAEMARRAHFTPPSE